MTNRYTQIGFSQRVRLEWLEHASRLVASGNAPAEIEAALKDILGDKLSVGGTAERGNREKAITILLKVWVRPPQDIVPLRDEGLKLLQDIPQSQHPAVHWGLSMAVYPFWATVAETTGRLLRLQGTAAASQVQRRVKESYGERETVARAARRVLRSFHDWGVLKETGVRGIYEAAAPISLSEPRTIAWMIEALLWSKPEGRAPLETILNSPALFPVKFAVAGSAVATYNARISVARHGLDSELVFLRGH
jgi:hypothetical protein